MCRLFKALRRMTYRRAYLRLYMIPYQRLAGGINGDKVAEYEADRVFRLIYGFDYNEPDEQK